MWLFIYVVMSMGLVLLLGDLLEVMYLFRGVDVGNMMRLGSVVEVLVYLGLLCLCILCGLVLCRVWYLRGNLDMEYYVRFRVLVYGFIVLGWSSKGLVFILCLEVFYLWDWVLWEYMRRLVVKD